MTNLLLDQLDTFVSSYIDLVGGSNRQMLTEFDADWLSPCIQASESELSNLKDGAEVAWLPVLQPANVHLNDLAAALELTIDPQLEALFCRYYSHDLPAQTERGDLDILQAWNKDDFERLQKNLISHVLMKRRLKQAETLFFATTDQDDFIISVEVASGEVVLEQVGKTPQEVLAPDLASFFATLRPRNVVVSF